MELRRLTPRFGAEVLSAEPDPAELRAALIEHKVLLLHLPDLTPDEHMALGRSIGEIEVHAFFPNLGEGYEQVSVLDSNEGNTATMWHTDESFLPHPPMGTLTRALVMPPVGGDTLFADTASAYEALSAPMKRYIDGLEAWHDLGRIAQLRYRYGSGDADALAEALRTERRTLHPIAREHPETGQTCIYVNPTYTTWIDGVPPAESDMILAHLQKHTTSEQFTYRHRWQVGDLLIWDNRSTQHMVLNDFAGHRRMERVSVVGDPQD
jgi:taurine dioxygenase